MKVKILVIHLTDNICVALGGKSYDHYLKHEHAPSTSSLPRLISRKIFMPVTRTLVLASISTPPLALITIRSFGNLQITVKTVCTILSYEFTSLYNIRSIRILLLVKEN